MAEPWFFDVLPARPAPYAGECLSGYLLRLAEANGLQHLRRLTDELFPRWRESHQIGLLRWEHPVEDWGCVPQRTQLPLAALRRLTVAPWLEKFRTPLTWRPPRAVSPGGVLRGIIHPQLQVCPRCLEAQPFIRLLWRLQPVVVCLDHGCLLQSRCPHCRTDLTPVGIHHRHLHCPVCDADLRTLSSSVAAPELLAVQEPKQAALRFLLDPDITLVQAWPQAAEQDPAQLARAVGMKYRFLRSQAGLTIAVMARRLNTSASSVNALELGERTALSLYLAYLEVLGLSWPQFAALEVPPDWLTATQTLPHMSLRLCPTPDCPNHLPPPSAEVTLSADLPVRGAARFRCGRCGRCFTRTYAGQLTDKPRRPPIQPGDAPTVPKAPAEIARLVEMGLQGRDNREIARALGWGEKTVRMYWISLDLEAQVHQAQVQQRAQAKRARDAAIRVRMDASLQELLARDEKLSAQQVSRAVGFNADYLNTRPVLAAEVQEQVRRHNRQIAERQYERLRAQIIDLLTELPGQDGNVTAREIAQAVGQSADHLRNHFPELAALVRAALLEHQARLKTARSQAECALINAAAARLAAQGRSLGITAICREAGLSQHRCQCDSALQALIQQWIDDDAPHD